MNKKTKMFTRLFIGIFICLINYGIYEIFENLNNKLFLDITICWLFCTLIFFLLSYNIKNNLKLVISKCLEFFDKTFLVLLFQIMFIYLSVYLFKISIYLSLIFESLISYVIIYPIILSKKINIFNYKSEIKENGRIKWISIFKGILIILMVIGHTNTIFKNIIYSFHIPVFFMISGYLFKETNENFVEFTKRKFKSLMVPFVQIVLVTTLISVIASKNTNIFYNQEINFNLIYYFLRYFVTSDLAGATWFLPTLFFTNLIFKFITDYFIKKQYSNKKVCIYSFILCFILGLWGYTYYNKPEGLSYNFDLSFLASYMFALGFAIKTFKKDVNGTTKSFLLIISILFFIYYNYNLVSRLDWPSRIFPNIFLLTLISFSAFYIISNICIKISRLKLENKLLCYIGDNSIDVLAYHFLGFRVLFYILYLFNIVGIEQTRSLLPLYNSTKYGLATSLFAIIFSLFFGRIMKFVFNKINFLINYVIKQIQLSAANIFNKVLMLNKTNKKLLIISIIISFLQIILSFMFDKIIFIEQGSSNIIIPKNWMYISKVLLLVILIWCWFKILSKSIKNYKFIIFYFLIMLIFFILVYPGIWRWDDIINLGSLTNGNLYYWQHYLSGIYFYLCMCLIPIPSGIIFIQILIISVIVGHIIGNEYKKIGKKALILYLIFLMPAVIDSNFYPIRANICAYIELYIFYELLNLSSTDCKNIKIIFLTIITAVLSVWRPENFVYIIIIPILLMLVQKISIKKVAFIFSIGFILMMILMNIQTQGLKNVIQISSSGNKITERELYTLSGFVTPLGELVKQAIDKNEFQDDLKEIDKMISVKCMYENGGLGAFWNGGVKSLTPNQLDRLKKITVKMAFSYLPELILDRYNFFLSANGYVKDAQMLVYGSAHIYNVDDIDMPKDIKYTYEEFQKRYILNKPFNANIRRWVISTLEMKKITDFNSGNKTLSMIFYNCTYSVITTCIIWLIALIKKKWKLVLLITTLAAKFCIIVATAPMSAYMYYFSTHLICSFITFNVVIKFLLKIKSRNLKFNKKC